MKMGRSGLASLSLLGPRALGRVVTTGRRDAAGTVKSEGPRPHTFGLTRGSTAGTRPGARSGRSEALVNHPDARIFWLTRRNVPSVPVQPHVRILP